MKNPVSLVCSAIASAALLIPPAARGATTVVGDLPRAAGRPVETLPDVDTELGVLRIGDDTRLRTIVTRPTGARGRMPAVQFVQWLSCDSIELQPDARDGWSAMLRALITRSGVLWQRVDKSGVGDSQGPACSELDYETELEQHRAALRRLLSRPDVDPKRVVVFGASMGSNFAPLLAADQPVAGVAVWGGGATTWFERMLRFERNALELGDTDPARLAPEVSARAAFLERYLLQGKSPAAIAQADPELGKVWSRLVGTEGPTHYGRPIAFHQQAQRQNWTGAWARVKGPVLVLYGEYDWFESRDAAALIADVLNRARPGSATLEVFPGTDHHFTRYKTRTDAFRESGGVVAADPVVEAVLAWLARIGIRPR
jgi:pimeloyl-ACP methyl ester carboxylesterase